MEDRAKHLSELLGEHHSLGTIPLDKAGLVFLVIPYDGRTLAGMQLLGVGVAFNAPGETITYAKRVADAIGTDLYIDDLSPDDESDPDALRR